MPARARPDPAAAPTPADIRTGAAALGIALGEPQSERLARFATLLQRWNAVHNLSAIHGAEQVLSHHLLDSLAVVSPIEAILGDLRSPQLIDVGSGGGLPGIPLAVARPGWRLLLVDKVEKKAAFLTQAKLDLGLDNVECTHSRVEELGIAPVDMAVSRAFASLADFVALTRARVRPGGWWAALKGAYPAGELADLGRAHPAVRVVDVVKLAVPRLDAERHLVLLQST